MTSKSKRIIIKKVLKLTSNYKKAAEYKINIWKSTVFLYTSNEQVEFEIKNTMPFKLVYQKMKYLGISKPNNKGPSSQGYGFSSGHVWMWELDFKKAPKNWCFWTVVLEKILESLGLQGDPTSIS